MLNFESSNQSVCHGVIPVLPGLGLSAVSEDSLSESSDDEGIFDMLNQD